MGAWRRLIGATLPRGSDLLKRQQIRLLATENARFLARRPIETFFQETKQETVVQKFHRCFSAGNPAAATQPLKPVEETPKEEASIQSEKTKAEEEDDQLPRAVHQPEQRNPISWMSFFLLVATAAAILYVYNREKHRKIEELKLKEVDVKYGPSVGKAAIGGPLKLVNHEGKTITEKDFDGKWTLMYFGFTSCPDICPDELQKMVVAIDNIEKKTGLQIAPLFISVDPERDTVEQMKEYVQEFHPRLMGLTGPAEEIKQLAKSFRVYYMKTGDEGGDYLVDHSIIMYLMGPSWEFIKFYGKNYTMEELSQGIIDEVRNYNKQHETKAPFWQFWRS